MADVSKSALLVGSQSRLTDRTSREKQVLGRVVTPTNVTGVLMIDATATEIFPTGKPNPTWTMYNPADETACKYTRSLPEGTATVTCDWFASDRVPVITDVAFNMSALGMPL